MLTCKDFLHELSDMLDAERKILNALEEQANESTNPQLQKAFQQHREQTQGQVERLETCFEELDEEPEETECAGIKGLIEEHDNMKDEDPSDDILDIFNAVAASKVERYEITAYESLIRLADMMEHTKVSRLLKQNLREEEQTLKKVQAIGNKLKPEDMGMEEEEEVEEETMETETFGGEEGEQSSRKRGATSTKSKSRKGRAA